MIEVKELTRNYGNFVAVDHISFEIPKGQIVGLLGHNGAGKTTTLKMLTGFLEPTSGEITINGLNLIDHRIDVQKKMGYLPENAPIYPEMTVLQYLHFAAELHGVDPLKKADLVKDAIEKIKLTEKASSLISTLSKGYRQRVCVAQSILHHPDILVLDEPTNGLDPSQIFEMRSLIKDISKNATVIVSTHILQEVQAICDRVIIIHQGKIAKDALIKDLETSNAISLSIQAAPKDAKHELKKINGVKDVSCYHETKTYAQYRLKLDQDWQKISPEIASFVNKKGWPLFEIKQERVDLESLFHQIDDGKSLV